MISRSVEISIYLAVSLSLCVAAPRDGYGPGLQEWGHVTVREGAHMFYWLYYTTANVKNYTDKPLTIWLQGGPGASSTGYGNFEELGPLDLNQNYREHTWVKDMNVLFIDNPVGSGFSYVDNTKYLTKNNTQIAWDLVALMKGFYELNPEFRTVPLHIFCESYGGKMAAEFALELYRAIERKEIQSNFKSVSMGDSWIAPMDTVYAWAPLLINMGLVDHKGYDKIQKAAKDVENALDKGNYEQATNLWGYTEQVIMQESKGVDFYNILEKTSASYAASRVQLLSQNPKEAMYRKLVLRETEKANNDNILNQLMNNDVKKTLAIASSVKWGGQSSQTFSALSGDFMKPVVHIVEELLNTTSLQVVVYSGHLDLICATAATVDWVDSLNWPLKSKYASAARNGVSVKGILEGYSKKVDKFSFYWVNRAGHMVPNDNPAAMDSILKDVTKY